MAAMLTGKPEASDATIESIHRRFYADPLACRAEPNDEDEPDIDGSKFKQGFPQLDE